jgi:hypothetical protein
MFLKSNELDVADASGVSHIQGSDAGSPGGAGKEQT